MIKILYVEDDARFIVKKFLNKLYDIDFAENSNLALKRILEKNYDMILMDINLKNGLNGIELTQILRMLPSYQKVPIVAVTAYAYPDDKKEFLSKGITDYLSKPFLINELNDLVKKLINKIK